MPAQDDFIKDNGKYIILVLNGLALFYLMGMKYVAEEGECVGDILSYPLPVILVYGFLAGSIFVGFKLHSAWLTERSRSHDYERTIVELKSQRPQKRESTGSSDVPFELRGRK